MLQLPWRAVEEGVERLEEMSMLHGQTVSLEKPPDDFVLQEAKAIKNTLARKTTCVSYR